MKKQTKSIAAALLLLSAAGCLVFWNGRGTAMFKRKHKVLTPGAGGGNPHQGFLRLHSARHH